MRPPEAVLTNSSLLVIKPVLQYRQQAVPVPRRQRLLLSPTFGFLQIIALAWNRPLCSGSTDFGITRNRCSARTWEKRKFYCSKPLLGATAFALERAMQQEASENLTAKPTEFRGHHT